MGVCGCMYLCVCVVGGALNVHLDVTLLMAHPGLALKFFCPMVMMGWAGIFLPRAPWGTLHLSHGHYFFVAFVSPFCFSDVPRAGEGPGSHWSLVLPYISANGKLALFPFCTLSLVTFKGLFVSSGTSFHRCGQNLGVGTLFLSPERLCWRGRVAEAETGLCSVSQARVTLGPRAETTSRIIFLSHSWWLHLERWGPGERWWVRHGESGPGVGWAQEKDVASGLDPQAPALPSSILRGLWEHP